MTDKRPSPKPRVHPNLWQAYLIWNELVEQRKRHLLRISSITLGKSNLDIGMEERFIARMNLDDAILQAKNEMVSYGEELGDIWTWVTSIKGLGAGGLAAQLLAYIDDIRNFATVSKLWRHCGQGVVDGKAERRKKGEKAHFSAVLKSVVWQIAEQFIRQQTQEYVGIYYNEKLRQREIHPHAVCKKCGKDVKPPKSATGSYVCECGASSKNMEVAWTPAHIHNIAKRKMVKIFLSHLWEKWREYEGLPPGEPYVQAVMGHEHIIDPPEIGEDGDGQESH